MRVAALNRFPVKSCGAMPLGEATLDARGVSGDRSFALIGADGRALTQRDAPLLATIGAHLSAARLALALGGIEELELERGVFRAPRSAFVWGRTIAARAAPEDANRRLARYLGVPVELVALEPNAAQSLADAEPVLVVALATLDALNAQLAAPVGIERFRANLVLEGTQAFAELRWHRLAAGNTLLECVSACERCEVVTIDQASGARRGPEPLATLEARMGLVFGRYCRVARPGTLRVGDAAHSD